MKDEAQTPLENKIPTTTSADTPENAALEVPNAGDKSIADGAGCDRCGTEDRVPGTKFCEACARAADDKHAQFPNPFNEDPSKALFTRERLDLLQAQVEDKAVLIDVHKAADMVLTLSPDLLMGAGAAKPEQLTKEEQSLVVNMVSFNPANAWDLNAPALRKAARLALGFMTQSDIELLTGAPCAPRSAPRCDDDHRNPMLSIFWITIRAMKADRNAELTERQHFVRLIANQAVRDEIVTNVTGSNTCPLTGQPFYKMITPEGGSRTVKAWQAKILNDLVQNPTHVHRILATIPTSVGKTPLELSEEEQERVTSLLTWYTPGQLLTEADTYLLDKAVSLSLPYISDEKVTTLMSQVGFHAAVHRPVSMLYPNCQSQGGKNAVLRVLLQCYDAELNNEPRTPIGKYLLGRVRIAIQRYRSRLDINDCQKVREMLEEMDSVANGVTWSKAEQNTLRWAVNDCLRYLTDEQVIVITGDKHYHCPGLPAPLQHNRNPMLGKVLDLLKMYNRGLKGPMSATLTNVKKLLTLEVEYLMNKAPVHYENMSVGEHSRLIALMGMQHSPHWFIAWEQERPLLLKATKLAAKHLTRAQVEAIAEVPYYCPHKNAEALPAYAETVIANPVLGEFLKVYQHLTFPMAVPPPAHAYLSKLLREAIAPHAGYLTHNEYQQLTEVLTEVESANLFHILHSNRKLLQKGVEDALRYMHNTEVATILDLPVFKGNPTPATDVGLNPLVQEFTRLYESSKSPSGAPLTSWQIELCNMLSIAVDKMQPITGITETTGAGPAYPAADAPLTEEEAAKVITIVRNNEVLTVEQWEKEHQLLLRAAVDALKYMTFEQVTTITGKSLPHKYLLRLSTDPAPNVDASPLLGSMLWLFNVTRLGEARRLNPKQQQTYWRLHGLLDAALVATGGRKEIPAPGSTATKPVSSIDHLLKAGLTMPADLRDVLLQYTEDALKYLTHNQVEKILKTPLPSGLGLRGDNVPHDCTNPIVQPLLWAASDGVIDTADYPAYAVLASLLKDAVMDQLKQAHKDTTAALHSSGGPVDMEELRKFLEVDKPTTSADHYIQHVQQTKAALKHLTRSQVENILKTPLLEGWGPREDNELAPRPDGNPMIKPLLWLADQNGPDVISQKDYPVYSRLCELLRDAIGKQVQQRLPTVPDTGARNRVIRDAQAALGRLLPTEEHTDAPATQQQALSHQEAHAEPTSRKEAREARELIVDAPYETTGIDRAKEARTVAAGEDKNEDKEPGEMKTGDEGNLDEKESVHCADCGDTATYLAGLGLAWSAPQLLVPAIYAHGCLMKEAAPLTDEEKGKMTAEYLARTPADQVCYTARLLRTSDDKWVGTVLICFKKKGALSQALGSSAPRPWSPAFQGFPKADAKPAKWNHDLSIGHGKPLPGGMLSKETLKVLQEAQRMTNFSVRYGATGKQLEKSIEQQASPDYAEKADAALTEMKAQFVTLDTRVDLAGNAFSPEMDEKMKALVAENPPAGDVTDKKEAPDAQP